MQGERIGPCIELAIPIVAVMADIWRFVDGRADEHWEPAQLDVPE